MTDVDRTALRALAEAATAGPWAGNQGWKRSSVVDGTGRGVAVATAVVGAQAQQDSLYLAAASPDVILALLDAAETEAHTSAARLEAMLEATTASLAVLLSYPGDREALRVAQATLDDARALLDDLDAAETEAHNASVFGGAA